MYTPSPDQPDPGLRKAGGRSGGLAGGLHKGFAGCFVAAAPMPGPQGGICRALLVIRNLAPQYTRQRERATTCLSPPSALAPTRPAARDGWPQGGAVACDADGNIRPGRPGWPRAQFHAASLAAVMSPIPPPMVFLKPASAKLCAVVAPVWRPRSIPMAPILQGQVGSPSRVVSAPMSATSNLHKTFLHSHGGGSRVARSESQ